MEWINENDFIPLFLIKYVPFNVQFVGVCKKNGKPAIIEDDCNKDLSSRWKLIEWISFNDLRKYARESANSVSKSAERFLIANEDNWQYFYDLALEEIEDEFVIKTYSLTGKAKALIYQDVRYNASKK